MTPLEPPPRRHYTDRSGRILPSVLRAAAWQFYAPQGRRHHVRRGTIRECLDKALHYARREQARMADHPMRESIDAVDAIIARRCADGQDSILRDSAVVAHHERRPALVARRTNTIGMLAAFAVHDGHDLAAWIIANAEEQRRGLSWYAGQAFGALIPVNQDGADAIKRAQWALAPRARPVRVRRAA